jgi:translation initiation factor 1A
MGKNAGGNKAKRFARFNAPSTFRVAKEEGEIYGIVEKNMGNGIVNVLCIDSTCRMCIVRKKFARQHVQPGTWVLVGLREFETKKDKCDLLEVYTTADVARLQTMDGAWHILTKEQIEFEDVYIPEMSEPVELDMDVDFDEI